MENGYIDELERLEIKGKQHEKDIELAKFHEERGKVKCECYQCEEKKQVRVELKAEQKKIIDDYEQGRTEKENGENRLIDGALA